MSWIYCKNKKDYLGLFISPYSPYYFSSFFLFKKEYGESTCLVLGFPMFFDSFNSCRLENVKSEDTEECLVYLSIRCNLKNDGRDAWIFYIDDTLLSIVPFYKNNQGNKINVTTLEEWMSKGKAPALDYSLKLFNDIKSRGIQIILISGRREHLRSATIDNLVNVGYHGWTSLNLRDPANELVPVAQYKSEVRKHLTSNGYRIWGSLVDQFSSIEGNPSGIREFKLRKPMLLCCLIYHLL